MTALRREKGPMANDPMLRLNYAGQQVVAAHAGVFEATVASPTVRIGPESVALRRAMARYLIDTGLASANGYV